MCLSKWFLPNWLAHREAADEDAQKKIRLLKCTSMLSWPVVTGVRLTGFGSCLLFDASCRLQIFDLMPDVTVQGRAFLTLTHSFGGVCAILLHVLYVPSRHHMRIFFVLSYSPNKTSMATQASRVADARIARHLSIQNSECA